MTQNPEQVPQIDPGELAASRDQCGQLFARLTTQIPLMGEIDTDYYAMHEAANHEQAQYAAFLKDEVGATAVLRALGEEDMLRTLMEQIADDKAKITGEAAMREHQEIISLGAESLPAVAHVLDVDATLHADMLRQAGYDTDVSGVNFLVYDFSGDNTSDLLMRAIVTILYADPNIRHEIEFQSWRLGTFTNESSHVEASRLYKGKTLASGLIPMPNEPNSVLLAQYMRSIQHSGVADVRANEVDQVNKLLDLVNAQKGL